MLLETDLAWAAGIFDGEGFLGLSRRYDPIDGIRADVRVDNTNKNMLIKLRELFGGNVCVARKDLRPGRRQVYHWRLPALYVKETLLMVLPYLVIKQRQAEILIAFRERIENNGYKGYKLPEGEVLVRENMLREVKNLNGGS